MTDEGEWLFEHVADRREKHLDTQIVVHGDPDREHVNMLVEYIAFRLPGTTNIVGRGHLSKATEIVKSAGEGDTIVMKIGSIISAGSGNLELIEMARHYARVSRHKLHAWIWVSRDIVGTEAEKEADVIVRPSVHGVLEMVQYDPYDHRTNRVESDTITLKP